MRHRGCFSAARAAALLAVGALLVGGPMGQTAAADAGRPWMDPHRPPALRAQELLATMTFDEKVDLVTADYAPLAHLGVPPLNLADASSGIRGDTGVTAFPVPEALAATFDTSLAQAYGAAVGNEGRAKGWNGLLGTTVDIARTGLSGRQTEAYGEDPLLSGGIATQVAAGIKSQHEVSAIKHYTVYNQEAGRNTVNVIVSDRALHEIYNPPFQMAIAGGADGVMCSYPKINGTFSCENPSTLAELRTEADFNGLVMSDFQAGQDHVAAINAGVDTTALFPGFPVDAFSSGAISQARLDQAAGRILYTMFDAGLFDFPLGSDRPSDVSTPAHQDLATQVAEQSMVLLKNEQAILPLSRAGRQTIAVIGPAGADAITGVEGSSYVDPGTYATPLQAITSAAGPSSKVVFSQGSLGDAALPVVPSAALRTPDGASAGLLGSFYDNPDFSGAPAATEVSPTVDFTGKPVGTLPAQWSARWTGTITGPTSGLVRLSMLTAGTARVLVDGQPVVSGSRSSTSFIFGPYQYPLQGVVRLEAGRPVPITVEYSTAGAGFLGTQAHLGWQPRSLIPDAVAAAGKADAAVVFVNQASGEGMDRDGLNLPGDQDSLVEAVSRANPHTIVVLNTPGAVLMPWLHRVAAVIQAWYPGRAVGSATASVLFGDADPGGRLPVTFPASAAQGPIRSAAEYPGVAGQVSYDEGVFVGYRYYQEHGQTPLFPFGHGLSYSSFRYTDLRVVRSDGDGVTVEAKVTNVGPRAGTAVPQVYVGRLPTPVATPPRQLAGFAKVALRPGEAALLTMRVPGRVLSYWDEQTRSWVMPAGRVAVYVGNSSADTELTGSLLVGAG